MPLTIRARSRAVVVALLLLALVLPGGPPAAALPTEGDPVPVAYDFGPSGLGGAGFQNVVAFSPFRDVDGNRPLLLGGDIAGVHRSLDGGRSWTQSNAGLRNREVAALLFSTAIPGKVYAATDTGLAVSTDFGAHWTTRPVPVDFDANGVYRISTREHPRSTGTLLAQDGDGVLYAATATQGVKRSRDDGTSWERIALPGLHLRSIALDPADPDRLFVAAAEGGLHVSTDARTAMTFTRVPGSPAVVEEIRFVGGMLYAAAGTAGVHRYDGTWRALNTGLAVSGPSWQSLTGHVDADGRHVLLVGCSQPKGGAHTMRSDDGGQTWTSVASGPGVTWSDELYGSGLRWWARAYKVLAPSSFGFVASDLALDPDDPERLVLAGRAGVYVAVRDASGTRWWPAMDGLMATVNVMVAADPRVPGRVHVANVDWRYLPSTDGGVTFRGNLGPSVAANAGDVIALDVGGAAGQPAPVYLASSKRGINTGSGAIHSNPDPVADPTGWTNEQLPVTADVGALAVGRTDSGERVVLAAVGGHGLYRKVGGAWTRLPGVVPFATRHFGALTWTPGTTVVHAHDATGVWRSEDAGAAGSWVRIAAGSAGADGTGGTSLGSLAVDAARPDVVYASAAALGGVARISGAGAGSPLVETILPLPDPGPIALAPDGSLLAVDRSGARLLRADAPAAGSPAFADVGDDYFAANNASTRTLAVDADGRVYTASIGGGVSVAAPPGSAGPPVPPTDGGPLSAPTDLALRAVTARSATLAWTPATDDLAVVDYEVLRDDEVVGVVVASGSPAFVDTELRSDTSYGYRVRARDAAGSTGPAGDELTVTTGPYRDTSAPTGPASVRALLAGTTQVTLEWPNATDDTGVTGYRVTRDGQPVADVPGSPWTDTDASPGAHAYRVAAFDAAGNVASGAGATAVVPAPAPAGLMGVYFDTATFTEQKLARVDPTVDFTWGTGRPATALAPDTFSVRWTGRVVVPAAGRWTFITLSDEAVRLWVGGTLVVDHWTPHLLSEKRGVVQLSADRAHDVRIEFQERTGAAAMRLLWSGPGTTRQVLPSSRLLAG